MNSEAVLAKNEPKESICTIRSRLARTRRIFFRSPVLLAPLDDRRKNKEKGRNEKKTWSVVEKSNGTERKEEER